MVLLFSRKLPVSIVFDNVFEFKGSPPSWATWIPSLGPTWQKKEMDHSKLSSDLHLNAVAYFFSPINKPKSL